MYLTVVPEQSLCRTLSVWAGGLSAASTVKTNATVGATVASYSHAPIYAALLPQTFVT